MRNYCERLSEVESRKCKKNAKIKKKAKKAKKAAGAKKPAKSKSRSVDGGDCNLDEDLFHAKATHDVGHTSSFDWMANLSNFTGHGLARTSEEMLNYNMLCRIVSDGGANASKDTAAPHFSPGSFTEAQVVDMEDDEILDLWETSPTNTDSYDHFLFELTTSHPPTAISPGGVEKGKKLEDMAKKPFYGSRSRRPSLIWDFEYTRFKELGSAMRASQISKQLELKSCTARQA